MVRDRQLLLKHALRVGPDGSELDDQIASGEQENAVVVWLEPAAGQHHGVACGDVQWLDGERLLALAFMGHRSGGGAKQEGETKGDTECCSSHPRHRPSSSARSAAEP